MPYFRCWFNLGSHSYMYMYTNCYRHTKVFLDKKFEGLARTFLNYFRGIARNKARIKTLSFSLSVCGAIYMYIQKRRSGSCSSGKMNGNIMGLAAVDFKKIKAKREIQWRNMKKKRCQRGGYTA